MTYDKMGGEGQVCYVNFTEVLRHTQIDDDYGRQAKFSMFRA